MRPLPYLTKTPGIGGEIKEEQEDFCVDELSILPPLSPDGKYAYFLMKKQGKATQEAISAISRATHVPAQRFSYAGQKDRQAHTSQAISIFEVDEKKVLGAKLPPSISLEFLGRGAAQVKIGALRGNRFRIKVRGIKEKNADGKVARIADELELSFPNYFGEQRFGMRANTHIVGKFLVQGKTEDAAWEYLCGGEIDAGDGAASGQEARIRLRNERDFAPALSYFPNSLTYERMMLDSLASQPNNFVRAFLSLPRPILLLFVHAYQSHLFNMHLGKRVEEGRADAKGALAGEKVLGSERNFGFPSDKHDEGKKWLALNLPGYEVEPNEYERGVLEDEEVRMQDFRVRQLPMLGARGGWRSALCPLAKFKFEKGTFSFALPSGSYATMALREFVDAKK